MSENTTEIVVSESTLRNEVAELAKGSVSGYSSIKGEDFATKLAVVNATDNATPLKDILNKPFHLKDVVVEVIDMADEKTGEVTAQPRVTLVATDGKSYHVISSVVLKTLRKYFTIIGEPHTWPAEGVKVVAVEGKARVGSFITLKVAA